MSKLEEDIQKQVIVYCRNKHKDDFFVFSIPNEALMKAVNFIPKNIRLRIFSKLKAMGFVSGLPDLVFIGKNKFCLIEMKNEKGTLTKSQKTLFPFIEKFIGPIPIARSLDDVLTILEDKKFI